MDAPHILTQFFTTLSNPALLGFIALMFVSPGPNNIMLTATGVAFGIRRGLPHLFGIGVGFAVMFTIVATGLGAVIDAQPHALTVIRVLGIATLLFLAWKIGSTQPQKFTTASDAHAATHLDDAADDAATSADRPISFLQAAIFQWVNPKAWIACATISALFLNGPAPTAASATQSAVSLVLALLVVGMPCSFCWLFFGVQIRRLIAAPRRQILFNRSMAGLLILTGLSFLF